MKRAIYAFIILVSLTFFGGACQKTEAPVHIFKDSYTETDQDIIGAALMSEIVHDNAKFPILEREVYTDAYEYVSILLKTLLTTENVHRRNTLDWEIYILQDDSYKGVFTTPGGKIFIYTGLLHLMEGEYELLGVLAHEIYYADTDVSMNRLVSNVDDAGFLFGDIVLGHGTSDLHEVVCTLRDMSYTETEVYAADDYALQLLCKFQYNAHGLRDLIQKAKAEPSEAVWLSTRPSSDERLENIETKATICSDEEAVFVERYQRFLSNLP